MSYIFFLGMRWGLFEQFTCQIALLLHQFLLYRLCPGYGPVSVLFSYVWLVGPLFNFGFDQSLSARYAVAVRSRHSFWLLVVRPLLFQVPVLVCGCFVFFSYFAPKYLLLLTCLATVEGVRRSLRIILQFSGAFAYVSAVEFLHTFLYLFLVWGLYFLGLAFSPFVLLAPMLFVNVMSLVLLMPKIIYFYRALTVATTEAPGTSRTLPYLNTLSNLAFSSSFLVPVSSALAPASTPHAALAGYVSYFLGSLFKRSFGTASAAAFARAQLDAPEAKTALFSRATSLLFGSLTLLALPILFFMPAPLALIVTLTLSEQLLLTYERFFLTENQFLPFTIINIVGLAGVAGATWCWHSVPCTTNALLIITARVLTLTAVAYLGFATWNIRPGIPFFSNWFSNSYNKIKDRIFSTENS